MGDGRDPAEGLGGDVGGEGCSGGRTQKGWGISEVWDAGEVGYQLGMQERGNAAGRGVAELMQVESDPGGSCQTGSPAAAWGWVDPKHAPD